MAKAKKEKLSLEELLKQALVKEEDQPYEVPGNWVWTKIKYVVEVNPTKRNVKGIDDETEISFIPMSSVSDKEGRIIESQVKTLGEVKKGYTNFQEDDVLFAKITPCMENGKSAIVRELVNNLGYGSTEFHVLRSSKSVLKEFVYYLVRAEWFREEAKRNMSGSVGQQRVPKQFLEEYNMPLPPLAEQQRIIERIESLFEKLDTAKQLVQNALDSFENRKAAILHKAFTGELTAKWREENGVSLDSWEEKKIGDICDCIVPGRDKPKSFTGNIPWITIPNLEGDFISNQSSELYLSEKEIQEVRAKVIPKGSVIMSCVGRFGISAIVDSECVINQQLHAFLPSPHINNKFLMYNIRYLKGYMLEKATSTTVAYLNKTACNSLPIYLPSIAEQEVIVKILEDVLCNEQQAQELCDVLEKIDLMKKAILARGFRGELGTNNPEEESAIELLKEVLKEKL